MDHVEARLAVWTDAGGGILLDKQTGLQWTQSENGKDKAAFTAVICASASA